jgi:hypothetical protein
MSRMTLSARARERGGIDGTGRGKGGEKRDGKKRGGGKGLHLKAQIPGSRRPKAMQSNKDHAVYSDLFSSKLKCKTDG